MLQTMCKEVLKVLKNAMSFVDAPLYTPQRNSWQTLAEIPGTIKSEISERIETRIPSKNLLENFYVT